MKVIYTGVQKELPPKLKEKLSVKFAKLSKMLEPKGEKQAHVVITNERHLHHAEITLNFYDHPLVGVGSDSDLFTAMSAAIEKLEKQAVKCRTKWRDTKRGHHQTGGRRATGEPTPAEEAAEPAEEPQLMRRVFRVNHHERRKPMTLEEAVLEMEKDRDYLVYRDAENDRVNVLVRRRDGDFDLIET